MTVFYLDRACFLSTQEEETLINLSGLRSYGRGLNVSLNDCISVFLEARE